MPSIMQHKLSVLYTKAFNCWQTLYVSERQTVSFDLQLWATIRAYFRFFGVIRVEPMNELSLLIFTGSNVSDYWTEMTCNAGTLTDWPGRWSLEDYTSNTSTNYYNIHASLTCMRSSCFFIGQFSFLAFFRINLADIRVYSPLPLPKISAKNHEEESFLLQKNNSVTIRFHKIILFFCFIYIRGKSLRFSSFFSLFSKLALVVTGFHCCKNYPQNNRSVTITIFMSANPARVNGGEKQRISQ